MSGIYSRDLIVAQAQRAMREGKPANPYPAGSPAAAEFHAAYLDAEAVSTAARQGEVSVKK